MVTQRLPPVPSEVVPVPADEPSPVMVIGTAIVTAPPVAVSCVMLTEPPQLPVDASAAIMPPALAPPMLMMPVSASNVIEPPEPPALPASAAL